MKVETETEAKKIVVTDGKGPLKYNIYTLI